MIVGIMQNMWSSDPDKVQQIVDQWRARCSAAASQANA